MDYGNYNGNHKLFMTNSNYTNTCSASILKKMLGVSGRNLRIQRTRSDKYNEIKIWSKLIYAY